MKKDFGGIERRLTEQMKDYNYGQMNLLKGDFDFFAHNDSYMEIRKFYSGPNKDEVCHFQAEKMKYDNPDLGLIRVSGHEPDYFNKNSNHCYLMLARKELPENFWALGKDEKASYLLSSNPLVIDPSFKKVLPAVESGYTIKNIRNFPFSNTYTLKLNDLECEWVPLGITKSDKLLGFGIYHKEAKFFLKDKSSKKIEPIEMNSLALNNVLKSQYKLANVVDLIRKKYDEFILFR